MPNTPIEWQWETIKTEFQKGSDLTALQQEDLLQTYTKAHDARCGRITLEDIQTWSSRGDSNSEFPAQDLTLYTHTNVHTRDVVKIWNYGMVDNDYGTLHFVLADGTTYLLSKNEYGDLWFGDFVLPESASEDTRRVVAGIIKWYDAVEKDCNDDFETALDNWEKWGTAPCRDPDTIVREEDERVTSGFRMQMHIAQNHQQKIITICILYVYL